MTGTRATAPSVSTANPAVRPLVIFAGVAVPAGWVFLSAYQVAGLPAGPFVLLTLFLGLVLPAIVLTRRDATADGRRLWRDCYRRPRPLLILVPALGLIPALTALVAHVGGVGRPITTDVITGMLINIASSVLIVNLWEELAWAGFFQRRAMARWGLVLGSMVTAVLFAAIHLPLAFDGATGASDVLEVVGYMLMAGMGMRLLVAGFDVWSQRSLLTLGVLHASFNAAGEVVQADSDIVRYLVTLVLGGLVLLTPARHAYQRDHRPMRSDKELEGDH